MKKICFLLLTIFTFLLFPGKILASSEIIRDFKVAIVANKDGTMDLTESIVYDFGSLEKHGIYRDITTISKVGDLYRVIAISNPTVERDGQTESFSIIKEPSYLRLKIGQANKTMSGLHAYTITYKVSNGIGSNFTDHDEIFWNATGNNWQVPIEEASIWIASAPVLPGPKMECFTGTTGSKEQNCTFATDQPDNPVVATKSLQAGEGLSVVWEFPKGTFPESILQTQNPIQATPDIDPKTAKVLEAIMIVVFLIIPVLLNLVLAPILLIWYFKNKRKERFGSPSVNFDLPEVSGQRVLPAEAGSIDINRVDQNDVIATIFDLAIRKYLKIAAIKKEKVLGVFGGGEDYQLIKLKKTDEDLDSYEKTLTDRLFEDGDKVALSSLNTDFYETFAIIQDKVFQSLIERGFYTKNPKNQMVGLLVLGIFFILFGQIILGAVVIYLSRKLNGRTAQGDEMDWKIDGLKIFLKNMKRHYTWQAKNLYTVEKYIPYAIAFGYIKEFMEQLKEIYPNYKPTWYNGNLAFMVAMNSMSNSMSSSFTTHAPSSSSGFSGGGFSGGGGGGGGGGSW